MVNILVGAALGFLSGLGVGGGSLLLLWLTAVVGMDHREARVLNLMFFVPCALIAVWLRRKQTGPIRNLAISAAVAGLVGALLGNWLSPMLDARLLKKAFGVLFLITGLRELRWKPMA